MLKQISVYTENKKGAARKILSVLSAENINVLGFNSSDGGEFGTLRMILSDTERGCTLLTKNGYLCRVSEVIGMELEDTPGALEQALAYIEDMNINVNYIYVGYSRKTKAPLIILHADDMDVVSAALKSKGLRIHPLSD